MLWTKDKRGPEREARGERGIVVKTAKKSYLVNYVLAFLLAILLSILYPFIFSHLNTQFTLQPRSATEAIGTFIVLGFIMGIGLLIEEPFVERMMRRYIITNEEVIKIEGVIRKNRLAIPTRSISDIDVHKGLLGRIFNFGDISVRGFKNDILIRGVSEPEVFYRIIKNKVSIIGSKRGKRGRVTADEAAEDYIEIEEPEEPEEEEERKVEEKPGKRERREAGRKKTRRTGRKNERSPVEKLPVIEFEEEEEFEK